VPFVDPDPMLSYFTEAELGNNNDANWVDPRYEELYLEQKQEVDPARRLEIVHEMVRLMYDNGGYIALWYAPDLQAYRTDKFEGWVRQPADIGPVIFSQSSPTYALLHPIGTAAPGSGGTTPDATTAPGDTTAPDSTAAPAPATTAASGDDDGGGNGAVIAIVVAVLAAAGLGGFALARRRKTADERE
jgi:peptide/nickel transport system substrate-binding protein